MTATDARSRQLLRVMRAVGTTSRAELRSHLGGMHANLVGDAITRLMDLELVRERSAADTGRSPTRGRPRLKLEINSDSRTLVGVAIAGDSFNITRTSLEGRPLPDRPTVTAPLNDALRLPARMVRGVASPSVLAIGIACTGFVDVAARKILLSGTHAAKTADRTATRCLGRLIDSLRAAMPAASIHLTNDMHALAARYTLESKLDRGGDTLLVGLDDGRIGASVLIRGEPNQGCVLSANELGHMRMAVATERCFCGGIGCVERIFSGRWLHAQTHGNRPPGAFSLRMTATHHNPIVKRCIELTALAVANAINFIRPGHVVLASPLASAERFTVRFEAAVCDQLLPVLRDRVRFDWWTMPLVQSAETAALAAFAAWLNGDVNA